MPKQSDQLALYQKILTEEFIRELMFLLDVFAGRAQELGMLSNQVASAAGGLINRGRYND